MIWIPCLRNTRESDPPRPSSQPNREATQAYRKLTIAFHNSAEGWLNQQLQYDLWRAERSRKRLRVPNCVPPQRCKLLNPAEHDDPLDNAHPRLGDYTARRIGPPWRTSLTEPRIG